MRTLLFALLATTALSVQAAHANANVPDYRARVNTIAGNSQQTVQDANAFMQSQMPLPASAPTRFYESPARR